MLHDEEWLPGRRIQPEDSGRASIASRRRRCQLGRGLPGVLYGIDAKCGASQFPSAARLANPRRMREPMCWRKRAERLPGEVGASANAESWESNGSDGAQRLAGPAERATTTPSAVSAATAPPPPGMAIALVAAMARHHEMRRAPAGSAFHRSDGCSHRHEHDRADHVSPPHRAKRTPWLLVRKTARRPEAHRRRRHLEFERLVVPGTSAATCLSWWVSTPLTSRLGTCLPRLVDSTNRSGRSGASDCSAEL